MPSSPSPASSLSPSSSSSPSSSVVSRRAFTGLVGGGALALAAGRPSGGESAPRPNILWLTAEDQSPVLGAYGDDVARTPTLDRLAREGIRYDHAYATAPVCAPSRFALVTGVHPYSAGPAHQMRADGNIPGFLRGFPEYLRTAGYYCTNNSKTDYNTTGIDVAATWDASSDTAHWRDRPDGAPFFAVFNHMTTHESQLIAAADATEPPQTRPEDVRIPAYLPDTPEMREEFARYHDLVATLDGQIAARLAELEEAGLAEDTIVFYYSDHGGVVPRSKRHLYDEGLRTPLIVRFPEKWAHLAPGAPGSAQTVAVTSVDYAPTVLALAGVPIPRHLQGRSFLRAEPGEAAYAFGGRGRMDEVYDHGRTVRDHRFRYIRNYAPHRPWGQFQSYGWQARGYQEWEWAHLDGTLDATQDRFFGPKPGEELYDLDADPDQIHDLAREPRHAATLRRLRRALDDHILAVHDNGFLPEGSPLEGWDASRAPGAYPLRRVLRLAGRAIEREPRHLPEFTAALRESNEAVRYWGAQGLLILGTERRAHAAPAREALARAVADDDSPRVRVAAAEAWWFAGADEAVEVLAATLDDASLDARARLQAINALIGVARADLDAVRPAYAAVARAAASADDYLRRSGRYLILVLDGTYTPDAPVLD